MQKEAQKRQKKRERRVARQQDYGDEEEVMERESYWNHFIGIVNFLPDIKYIYRQTSNTSSTLVGSIIVYHSDVVGALHVGAAPTTSSFLT